MSTAAFADVFVDSLCRHGELIIFSAAVPGQGGERHVNEQPLEYWREKFAGHAVTPHSIGSGRLMIRPEANRTVVSL